MTEAKIELREARAEMKQAREEAKEARDEAKGLHAKTSQEVESGAQGQGMKPVGRAF
ncbi:hypothetical protein D3C85_1797060 [compost metagenome]